MKNMLIAVAAIVWVAAPGLTYWSVSEDFSTTYTNVTVEKNGELVTVAETTCQELRGEFMNNVTSCYEWTEIESHTSLERAVKGMLFSLVIGLMPLWLITELRLKSRERVAVS